MANEGEEHVLDDSRRLQAVDRQVMTEGEIAEAVKRLSKFISEVSPLLPLSGSTQAENDDAAAALAYITNLLEGNPKITVWRQRLVEGGFLARFAEGEVDVADLFERAQVVCRELNLPSLLIASEVCWRTMLWALEVLVGGRFTETLWAAPKEEAMLRRKTERAVLAVLRRVADDIEDGALDDIPWPEYWFALTDLTALPGMAIERGMKEEQKLLMPGRARRHPAEVKAFCVYLKRVGGKDGPVPVRQIAREAMEEWDGKPFLETDDPENARRSVDEWIDYIERLLVLEPMTP